MHACSHPAAAVRILWLSDVDDSIAWLTLGLPSAALHRQRRRLWQCGVPGSHLRRGAQQGSGEDVCSACMGS